VKAKKMVCEKLDKITQRARLLQSRVLNSTLNREKLSTLCNLEFFFAPPARTARFSFSLVAQRKERQKARQEDFENYHLN